MVFLTRGVTIKFTDLRADPKRETTFYSKAACSFVRYLNKTAPFCTTRSTSSAQVDGMLIEAALQYTDS